MRKTATLFLVMCTVISIVFMGAWYVHSRVSDGEYYITTERGTVFDNPTPQQRDRVNINTAGAEELQTVPQIGPTRAEAIIAYREEHGDFETIGDIMLVKGISEATFEIIRDYIMVGGADN